MKNQPVPDDLISAYFDGEVTEVERRQVEQELESSAESRQLLEDAAKLSAILHSFPKSAVPADLARNVQQQIESGIQVTPASVPAQRSRHRREWLIFASGIVATIAPLVLFVVLNPAVPEPDAVRLSGGPLDNRSSGGTQPAREQVARADKTQPSLAMKMHEPLPAVRRAAAPADSGADPASAVEMAASAPAKPSSSRDRLDDYQPAAPYAASLSFDGAAKSDLATSTVVSDATEDGIPLEPDDPGHFIESLKKGEIAVRSVANSHDSVAVVEFVVVDINRAADEMEILLLRVLRNQSESDAKLEVSNTPGAAKGNSTNNDALKDSLTRSNLDELAMLYVRAPGDQLAQALVEAAKRPEIYLAVSPKIPMAFPDEKSDSRTKIGNGLSDVKLSMAAPTAESKPVSAEAGIVVNSFLNMNGIEIKNKDGGVNINQQEIVREYFYAHPGSPALPSAPVANSADGLAEPGETENDFLGFTELRVAVPKNTPSQEQKRESKQKLNLRRSRNQSQKNLQQADAAPNRAEQTPQNSQLMRMLIVLKSGQATPAP